MIFTKYSEKERFVAVGGTLLCIGRNFSSVFPWIPGSASVNLAFAGTGFGFPSLPSSSLLLLFYVHNKTHHIIYRYQNSELSYDEVFHKGALCVSKEEAQGTSFI
jgi:hypothetical protein